VTPVTPVAPAPRNISGSLDREGATRQNVGRI
jgi:hypothetical protein